ncbi:MAG: DUF1127 domain-containing protein [Kiloniellales bacterium]
MAAFCGERGRTVHAVTALPRRLWLLLLTWCARAAQRRALAALDHRLLSDAGLTRDQAAAESRKPFWRA